MGQSANRKRLAIPNWPTVAGRVRHPRGIALHAPMWHFVDLTAQVRANWYTSFDYRRKVYAAST
jgi:hypothetical protein